MSSWSPGAWADSRHGAWFSAIAVAIPVGWVLASSQPRVIIAIAGAIVLALLTLRWPIVAGVAVVASVPVQQVGAVGPLTATRALVLLAVAVTVLYALTRGRPLVVTRLALPFAALIGWMTVVAGNASNVDLAVDEILRWTIAFIAFLILLQLLVGATNSELVASVAAISVVAALQASLGILQSLFALGPASFEVAGNLSRGYGTFGRPNTYAGYLEMALFPTLWLGVHQVQAIRQRLSIYRFDRLRGAVASRDNRRLLAGDVLTAAILMGSAGIVAAGILTSFSRGAWLGVAFGLVVSAGVAFRKSKFRFLAAAPIVVLIAVVVGGGLAPAVISERVLSVIEDSRPFDATSIKITDDNFAAVERMAHWQAGWHMFRDHPITGVGPGNYNARYADYFVRSEFRTSQGHAHNFYIHSLAETGVVGLALYLVLIASALGLSVYVAVVSIGLPRALALGGVGTTVAVIVHNVFENLHVLNLGIQLGAAWALTIAAHRLLLANRAAHRRAMECGPL
ncbi:MAG TPA: O-antigen ligase family protein [Thermomicrobiales bacterium]|nr:O-antigen ligase family protein [Thermomicrobiales bacterium]